MEFQETSVASYTTLFSLNVESTKCKKIYLVSVVSAINGLVNKLGIVLIVANLLLLKKLKPIWNLRKRLPIYVIILIVFVVVTWIVLF